MKKIRSITRRSLKAAITLAVATASVVLMNSSAHAQIVTYPTSTIPNPVGSPPPDPAPFAGIAGANVVAGPLSRGAGLTVQTSGQAVNASGWNVGAADFASAMAANDYYTFTVAPQANYRMSLTGLTSGVRRSGTGPMTAGYFYSVDNFAAPLISVSNIVTNGTHTALSPSLSATNLSAATEFRLPAFGATNIGGTLRVGGATPASDMVLSGSTSLRPTGTLTWDGGFAANGNWSGYSALAAGTAQSNWDNNDIPLDGDSIAFAGSTRLANTNDYANLTVKNITFNSGAGAFVNGGNALNVTGDVTNNSSNTQTIAHNLAMSAATHTVNTASGDIKISMAISGNGAAITKTGTATLELSAANTYTGNTQVSQGTLKLTGAGSVNNSPVIQVASGATLDVSGVSGANYPLASGQTLAGTGNVVGKITISNGSTISPGNSPGLINMGDVAFNGGGNMNWQVVTGVVGATAGTDYDSMKLSGALDLTGITGGSQFNLNLWSLSNLPDVGGNVPAFNNLLANEWTLVNADGGITGFDPSLFAINVGANNGADGFTNDLGGGLFSVALDGNALELHFTPAGGPSVPEPASLGVISLGLLGLLRRSRRTEAKKLA